MNGTPKQSESPLSDELISAYLDDELSADQRAQVERMLADNEQWRRMLEELQALRSSIQALPQYELDEHFSQRVLQRAERQMLSTSIDQATPAAAQRSAWRSAAWTVATVAATALVMVFVMRDRNPRQLAHGPTQSQESAGQAAEEEMKQQSSRASTVNETAELAKGSSTTPMHPAADRQKDEQFFNKAKAAGKSGETKPGSRFGFKEAESDSSPSSTGQSLKRPKEQSGRGKLSSRAAGTAAMSLGLPRGNAPPPDAHLVIMRVDLTSTALKQRAFDRALAQHGIHLESSTVESDGNDVDLVYVEATAQQIDALLADLAMHTDRFRILASETADVDDLKRKSNALRKRIAGKDQAGPFESTQAPAIQPRKGPVPSSRARRLHASPAKIPLGWRSDRQRGILAESGRSARGKLEKKSLSTQPTVQVLFVLRWVESIHGAKLKQSPKEQVK